jgi:hypothetical protein
MMRWGIQPAVWFYFNPEYFGVAETNYLLLEWIDIHSGLPGNT